jgi:hypothetical protein
MATAVTLASASHCASSRRLRYVAKDAFLLAAASVFTLADQTRGDGLFVYAQGATIAMHSQTVLWVT